MTTNPLNNLAPYPRSVDDVTADSLGRYLAVQAWAHHTHRPTDREQTAAETADLFGLAWLLRTLKVVAPETADEAAKDLWLAWEDGGAVREWLWTWLIGAGIDPEEVTAAATDLAQEAA